MLRQNMHIAESGRPASQKSPPGVGQEKIQVRPDTASIACFRAWLSGVEARAAVERFAPDRLATRNACGALGDIRRALVCAANDRQQEAWAALLARTRPLQEGADETEHRAVLQALAGLTRVALAEPDLQHSLRRWLRPQEATVLQAAGVRTWAHVAARQAERERWWEPIARFGQAGARRVEDVLACHPSFAERMAALRVKFADSERPEWMAAQALLPDDGRAGAANAANSTALTSLPAASLDGSAGTLRAPVIGCLLSARNDREAVATWLDGHESQATRRAYRKEIERLMLWAMVERRKPLSSLTHEDAIAYRAFLRRPVPAARWVGPVRPRQDPRWRPFQGPLSAASVAYSLSVVASLFRWLTEQRYLLGNPFAGIRAKTVKAALASAEPVTERAFTSSEWRQLRRAADVAESRFGWSPDAASRLRFILDFNLGTGLRVSELAVAQLRHITAGARRERWISVRGKGNKRAQVPIPPLSWEALLRELRRRGLPRSAALWPLDAYLIGSLEDEVTANGGGIGSGRVWAILRRFFEAVAAKVEARDAKFAERLRSASPHWLRHTHASFALAAGVELVTVRDNLRHASIATTSRYVHTEAARRARQLGRAFGAGER